MAFKQPDNAIGSFYRIHLSVSLRLCVKFFKRHVTAAMACIACVFCLDAEADLKFNASGSEFTFNTGELQGTLRRGGRSFGITPVTHVKSGRQIAAPLGLLSPYRLLDAKTRYLPDAREWKSAAELLEDGAVKVRWEADEKHPFDLEIIYRWATPLALDAIVTVRAKRDLPKFEVFMACYFNRFDLCHGSGERGLVGADRKYGEWLCFPRDDAARGIVADGRWKHPPHPVEFNPVQNYTYPLCTRASLESGLIGIMMARPEDCFAVLMPYHEESHYSLYGSLFGYDIKEGQSAEAHCRVVIGKDLSEKDVMKVYEEFKAGSEVKR